MNWDELQTMLGVGGDALFTVGDILLAMVGSTILSLVLSWVYTETHTGPNYSRTFLVSMFIMSVSTSVVMLIIGSNIARAFSLIGALSIIRFRTAVKDPRDTAFLFAGVVAGMGCGTGFFLPAFLLVIFLSLFLYFSSKYNLGSKENVATILKVNVAKGFEAQGLEDKFENLSKSFSRINQIEDFSSSTSTLVYSLTPKSGLNFEKKVEELRGLKGINQLSIYQADQHAPF